MSEAVIAYPDNNLKGEIVLIIAGAKEDKSEEVTLESAVLMAQDFVLKGMSKNDAAKTVAKQTGLKKGDIYKAIQ